MARYYNYAVIGTKNVAHVKDFKPQPKFNEDLCTCYGDNSDKNAGTITNSLNMAYELKQLSRTATKKQMLEIINKYC